MKINKIFLLAAMALTGMGLSSCSDDDDYTPGKAAGSYNVYFVDEADQAVDLSATSFTIKVGRADAGSALSVPLKQLQVASVFTVPSTVEFAAGQSEAEVAIQMSSDAEAFTDYTLRLAIPEEYTSPYKQQDYVSEMNIRVHKEDYKPYAKIEYSNGDFFFGGSWEEEMTYSETMGMYRMAPYAAGYYMFIKIADDGSITVCNSAGKAYTGGTLAGFTYSDYGDVSANWDTSAYSGYDEASDTYYILYKWTVSAGSFGSNYDWFKIISKY